MLRHDLILQPVPGGIRFAFEETGLVPLGSRWEPTVTGGRFQWLSCRRTFLAAGD